MMVLVSSQTFRVLAAAAPRNTGGMVKEMDRSRGDGAMEKIKR
jgi:hypothetical protein